jgi:hypothetical protein
VSNIVLFVGNVNQSMEFKKCGLERTEMQLRRRQEEDKKKIRRDKKKSSDLI